MENTMNNNTEFTPLGKVLRGIVEKVKVNQELEALGNTLIDLANKGNTSAQFKDLRKYVPSIVKRGDLDAVKNWAAKNELEICGQINEDNGAWEYTIRWE